MNIDIDKDNMKQAVLGLVLALVEIIRDILRTQAVRRMEGGSLTGEEVERLGRSLMQLDQVIEQLKEEHGAKDAVRSVRDELDGLTRKLLMLDGGEDGRQIPLLHS